MRDLMRAPWFWLATLVLLASCAAPTTAGPMRAPDRDVHSEAPELRAAVEAPPATAPPWRRLIYRHVWSSLDATLLGVDPERRRAFIKLRQRKPARYVIDTVDIDTGERIERWEAGAERASLLADYDARFAPLDDALETDLRRLGAMLSGWSSRAHREGSAWPVADASPDGHRVVFMKGPTGGREGDWLFLHDVETSRSVRIGPRAIASYDAKFSPDGQHLAWRGCIGQRPCRYALYMSSIDGAAKGQPPHRIDSVREPRGPIWSPDGEAVYALATNQRGDRCVMRTTVPSARPWRRPKTTEVVCDPKLAAFVLSPDGESILYTKRDAHDSEVAWRGVDAVEVTATVQLRHTSELTINDRGLVLGDHQKGLLALDLEKHRRRLYVSDDGGFVFVPNIHWLEHDTAIMLEKSFADQSVRLVQVNVSRFLDGA